MRKNFRKVLSSALAATMLLSSVVFAPVDVMAANFSTVGGWYETLYAEWTDSNPDSTAVKVGYKLSSASSYTYLSGDDYTYLIRQSNGNGRVDIPGLKAGTYDIEVTASDGTVYTKTGVEVYAHDRSGYAHFNYSEGVGAYNNDGTPKSNAIIVYVTDDNKNSVTIPGYGNQTINYTKSTGATWTRDTAGIGDILNNNYTFIKQVTVTDNHPLIFRFVGTVNAPENLTPPGQKSDPLGGGVDDNGYLAIAKDSRNITLEGIGSDATINGWGFTFSKSSTAGADTDKNFEVRNLTFQNYPEDGVAFQGHDSNPIGVERCWVHNNTFKPGHADKDYSSDGDKGEGDGSCDFKRGSYYTMSYNHFVGCHKTNLLGSGSGDNQWYMTLHHNWYEKVGSRQPLAANGNVHIYSTYFQGATSTTVDTRYKNSTFLEENYYDSCKNYIKLRTNTCRAKSYNETIKGGSKGSTSGVYTVASSRAQSVLTDNTYKFPNGDSMKDWDMNSNHFYYKNGKSDVQVLTPAADVPTYVKAHAGTLQALTSDPGTTPGQGGGSTEVTTSKPSTEPTTEATTKAPVGGETTETTTSAPVVSGGYSHNFDDGTSSSFYTITGNVSESKGEVTYNGTLITQCLKMESTSNISFNAPKAGKLTLVFGGTTAAGGKRVNVDGTAYTTDANGIATIDLAAGSHTITKGDSINLFYMNYAVEGGDTTASTTESTTESTTQSTTESTTESTTQPPVAGVGVAVGSAEAKVGESVTIPVTVSGMNTLAAADFTLTYDTSKLNVTAVSAGNALSSDSSFDYNNSNGTIKVAAVNPRNTMGGNTICTITATLLAEGTSSVNVTVNSLYAENLAKAENVSVAAGTVKANAQTPERVMGDANGDGVVNDDDVKHILQYVTKKISAVVDAVAADVTGDNKVTTRDANKIKKFVLGKIASL